MEPGFLGMEKVKTDWSDKNEKFSKCRISWIIQRLFSTPHPPPFRSAIVMFRVNIWKKTSVRLVWKLWLSKYFSVKRQLRIYKLTTGLFFMELVVLITGWRGAVADGSNFWLTPPCLPRSLLSRFLEVHLESDHQLGCSNTSKIDRNDVNFVV